MRVLGTAGHVDHGKSTLVEALTGTHPDRLKEEREREMTIDLGFAWFDLPGGEPVGVIDVPGHRDFIENMLAGVGGIDAALFVVAADEGVMPQTREHLAILDLLQIPGGVVALTKTDLAESDEWLGLVAAEVAEALRGTVLEGAPIVPVSARQGAGLDELRLALRACLDTFPRRPDLGRPRLPIDRVFTIAGFGTVITGTLVDGALAAGDEVEIYPRGLRARIRGLQTHKQKLDRVLPGSRAAINLTGIETAQLRRGDVLALPGTLAPSQVLDVRYRQVPGAPGPLKHGAEVKFFTGAAEVAGRARVLGRDSLAPGEEGWLQLVLAGPVAVRAGDRFILRRPSPGETIGGGSVADPHPRRKHRRHDPAALTRLETLLRGSPADLLLQALEALGPAPLRAAIVRAGLEPEAAAVALQDLDGRPHDGLTALEPGARLSPDAETLVTTATGWARLSRSMVEALRSYHAAQPLRAGMPREELKSRLGLATKVFNAVVAAAAAQGLLVEAGPLVRLPGHAVRFSAAQQAAVEALLAEARRAPYATPLVKDAQARLGEDVYAALVDRGDLAQLNEDVFFLRETYLEMVERVREELRKRGRITVAEVRDLFGASRKYALALMEHLDKRGITVRRGDERLLR
jgi:selenocysteine-specific elongation factor